MNVMSRAFFLSGLVLFGSLTLRATEELLVENFDGLAAEGLATQGGWADNSKTGTAVVAAEDSATAPNHLELSEGGAVHHAIDSQTGPASRIAMEFAFERKASTSGRNLQFSLRDSEGQSLLFLNIRGSGKSLDLGLNGNELTEYPFAEELPKGTWLQVKAEWTLSDGQFEICVKSADGAEFLNQKVELPIGKPTRIVIGSTPSTPQAEGWALDDLLIEAKP